MIRKQEIARKKHQDKVNSLKKTGFKQPIAQVSGKQAKAVSEYSRIKGPWISGKRCECCNEVPALFVHHKKGKIGFADAWARLKDIPLLIDIRFWLAVCFGCHREIEENPTWAREQGYSLPRSENIE